MLSMVLWRLSYLHALPYLYFLDTPLGQQPYEPLPICQLRMGFMEARYVLFSLCLVSSP